MGFLHIVLLSIVVGAPNSQNLFEHQQRQKPTMGGTLPLFLFEKYLKANTVTIPIANHDNNQHAENENIRISNFFEGIIMMASLMIIK